MLPVVLYRAARCCLVHNTLGLCYCLVLAKALNPSNNNESTYVRLDRTTRGNRPEKSLHEVPPCERMADPGNSFYLSASSSSFERQVSLTDVSVQPCSKYQCHPTSPHTALPLSMKLGCNSRVSCDVPELSGCICNRIDGKTGFNLTSLTFCQVDQI